MTKEKQTYRTIKWAKEENKYMTEKQKKETKEMNKKVRKKQKQNEWNIKNQRTE